MFSKDLNSNVYFILIVIIIILSIIFLFSVVTTKKEILFGDSGSTAISLVNVDSGIAKTNSNNASATIEDISINTSISNSNSFNNIWSGSLNLLWNKLITDEFDNDLANIKSENSEIDLLNSSIYKTNNISTNDYYNEYGLISKDLISSIKNNLTKKYAFESKSLEDINFENSSSNDYLLYSLLNKKITFTNDFLLLNSGSFANKYENVSYFGINSTSKDIVRKQVSVEYYDESIDAIVLSLTTKQGDEIILAKNISGLSLNEVYENINNMTSQNTSSKALTKNDIVKIPVINFNAEKQIDNLSNSVVVHNDKEVKIVKAVEAINFDLDVSSAKESTDETVNAGGRNLSFNSDFYIFAKEAKAEDLYFAAYVQNIELFQ